MKNIDVETEAFEAFHGKYSLILIPFDKTAIRESGSWIDEKCSQ